MNKKVLFITLVLLVSIVITVASLLGCGNLATAFLIVVVIDSAAIIILGSGKHLTKHNTSNL